MAIKLNKIAFTMLFMCYTAIVAGQQQVGKATFYSKRATGARTASGERLHHDSLTCAHRTYPFGSLLKVINVNNGKEVVVRVTDRGPFGKGKIIDLSWLAAQQLGILSQGVASVIVEPVYLANVPYRMSDRIELPEISFDLSNEGYSFMDEWKKAAKKKWKPNNEAAKNKDKNAKKPTDAIQEKPRKPSTNNEPQSNMWSDVFKKIGF